jgi:2-keto-4-pentenoate hydratase/2-oxohepta-3-ene-1,7-dioic acid hydratase in catechol pathway
MKLARFEQNGAVHYGIIDGDSIRPVKGLIDHTPDGEPVPLAGVKLLAPCEPSKLICAGLNYTDHAQEMGLEPPIEPMIFLKAISAVIGPGDTIVYPELSRRVDYEGELGIVIGCMTRNVGPAEARACILGYTCVNDVTARDLQHRDGQWARAKSFDTFAPMGPWIETELDTSDLEVSVYLNGETKQSSSTAKMIFDVYDLVSFVSRVMTLLPGDVISTGTPPGIGPMNVGDEIEVRIEGIGSLTNRVGK